MGLGADSPGGAESDIGGSESNAGNSSSSGGSGNESLGGYMGLGIGNPTSYGGASTSTTDTSSLDNDTVEALAVQAIAADPTRSSGLLSTDVQARDNSIENSLMAADNPIGLDTVTQRMNAWTGGLVDKDEVETGVNYWDRRRDYKAATDEEAKSILAAAKEMGIDTSFATDELGGTTGTLTRAGLDFVSDIVSGVLDTATLGLFSAGTGALGYDTGTLGTMAAQGIEDANDEDGGWGSTAGTAGTATSSGTSGSSAGPTGSSPGGFSTGGFSTTERDNQDASLAAALSTRPSDILLDSYKDSLAGKVT